MAAAGCPCHQEPAELAGRPQNRPHRPGVVRETCTPFESRRGDELRFGGFATGYKHRWAHYPALADSAKHSGKELRAATLEVQFGRLKSNPLEDTLPFDSLLRKYAGFIAVLEGHSRGKFVVLDAAGKRFAECRDLRCAADAVRARRASRSCRSCRRCGR